MPSIGTLVGAQTRAARSIAPSPPIAITMSEPSTNGCARVASQAVRSHTSTPLAWNHCATDCAIGAVPDRRGWAKIPTC